MKVLSRYLSFIINYIIIHYTIVINVYLEFLPLFSSSITLPLSLLLSFLSSLFLKKALYNKFFKRFDINALC